MRAWQVVTHAEPERAMRLTENVPAPEPGPGMLRVRVSHAGVGLPDVFMCRGGGAYALTPDLPFTPGQEVVGEVTAVGEGASQALGERVMGVTAFFLGSGGFADECLMLADFALPVPDAMKDAEAAGFVIPAHTAWIGLVRRAALAPGEILLVLGGSGGTGSAAIQLGKTLGARVIATASGDERTAFCRELGADHTIDRLTASVDESVRDLTDGAGVDVVYDPVGGAGFTAATRCIAHEGRLLVIGYASGEWGELSMPHLVNHSYTVMGVVPSGYDRSFRLDAQTQLLDRWAAGQFHIPVHAVLPFDRTPDALALVAASDVLGKVVVEVG